MTRVAPVKLKNNHRTLWFDPAQAEVAKGDEVVVSTARGLEMGVMVDDVMEVDAERVKKLKSPLKPVKRKATDEDRQKAAEMRRLSEEALPVFKEMAAETSEDMHPVSVEYLLDGDRAVFYFEAEERIDFRELVRKLASRFHVRVDMRQIGVRDEARMVGGLGHCGQELCCKRLGGEFCPVSIRMAKEQDLSLNPQKISGVCGRLMCCLRYEFDAYKDFKSRAPKKNALIDTPEGPAKVVDLDVPRETVALRTEDGQVAKVPLASFEPAEDGGRPHAVGREAWDEATAPAVPSGFASTLVPSANLTGKDKLAKPGAVRHTGGSGSGGSKQGGSGKRGKAAADHAPTQGRKPRRRSKVVTGEGAAADGGAKEQKKRGQQGGKGAGKNAGRDQASKQKKRAATPGKQQGGERKKAAAGAPRPGRKSSALRQQRPGGQQDGGHPSDAARRVPRDEQAPKRASGDGSGRRSRRRSHKAHGGDAPAQGTSGQA
ncbi:MAG TPA: hypothetical protein IAC12_04890 [Candidatus Aphodovivens avistercoris]|nr:hypothetical protein [Candidatus Aphodovivens avistercoris]